MYEFISYSVCIESDRTLTSGALLLVACGSPNYVAPEILDGDGYDGRRADIWTLGVILYVLATGRLPYDHPNMSELFSLIQKASYRPFPTNVSAPFKDLVSKLLVANPRKRLSLSEIQEHEWYLLGP